MEAKKQEQEIWKYIPELDGLVQVSTLGNIREYVQIIKQDGLPHVYINRKISTKESMFRYRNKHYTSSKMIYKTFFKDSISSLRIGFKDGNNKNLRPDNLYTTNSACKGEQNYKAKLTNKIIYQICYDFVNGQNAIVLGKKYDTHFQNIYRILYNKIWQSATRPTINRKIVGQKKKELLDFLENKLKINETK